MPEDNLFSEVKAAALAVRQGNLTLEEFRSQYIALVENADEEELRAYADTLLMKCGKQFGY